MSDYNPNFKVCYCGEVYFPGEGHSCAAKKHPIAEPDVTHVTPGMARATDPETSKKAAGSVNSAALEALVVDALRSNPDSSIQDIVEFTGERYRSISPRFAPLRRKGLIYVSGKKRAEQTGRTVQTWRAA